MIGPYHIFGHSNVDDFENDNSDNIDGYDRLHHADEDADDVADDNDDA